MSDLADDPCVPPPPGATPLGAGALVSLLERLGGGWRVVDGHHLRKDYAFPDFARALAFVNAVGVEAEAHGHHPDITLGWGRVSLEIWTHDLDGLSTCDFVLAAKCDRRLT